MPRTPLLRTGAFARAASLSVKALRLYHEMGLLVPSVVDPENGYRAYSPAQLTDAAIIHRLRAVGVSLQDIGTMLEARDPAITRKVLAEHAQRLEGQLGAVARLIDDLGPDEPDEGSVVIGHQPEATVLVVEGSPLLSDLEAFVGRSGRTLWEAANASGAVVEGHFGACYPTPLEEERQDVQAFLPIRSSIAVAAEFRSIGVRVSELSACDVAVLEHRGPYVELESCYRRLGAWVAFHAVPADQPVRETYQSGGDAAHVEPVTELLW